MPKKRTIKEIEEQLCQALEARARAIADYQNLERRVREDQEKLRLKANEYLLVQLFPVFDNLYRATKQIPKLSLRSDQEELKKISSYLDGLALVEGQLERTLTEVGLKKIPTKDAVFDHSFHEAISYEASETVPADFIIDEVESGWMVGQTVLRPAKVRVSSGDQAR